MLGLRHIKAPPTLWLLHYRSGRLVRQGAGISFFYFAPSAVLAAVPVNVQEADFVFSALSSDFQEISVQGSVHFRIDRPEECAQHLDFSLDERGRSNPETLEQLRNQLAGAVQVVAAEALHHLPLLQALQQAQPLAAAIQRQLQADGEVQKLGLEILTVQLVSLRPTPDMGRALEASAREAQLQAADEAIHQRRLATVASERAIRESELDTEAAVQEKERQLQQQRQQMAAEEQESTNRLRAQQLQADRQLEAERQELVQLQTANSRTRAEAEAYRLEALLRPLAGLDSRLVQALVAGNMSSEQLIAQAFGGLAEQAQQIGSLNISPELLASLTQAPKRK